MNASDIFLFRFNISQQKQVLESKLQSFFEKTKLINIINKNDLTAIKVHFGEKNNTTFLPPWIIKPLVDKVKNQMAKPFITDTNVLYKSERDNAYNHLLLAQEHGFSIEKMGAPIIIADGIIGHNETIIKIDAPINKEVYLATEFLTSNSIVVITHVTGHLLSGLGATIKNMGMGMASRKGKLIQHSISKPSIEENDCTKCEQCIKWCPANAIEKKSASVYINENKCYGCGECLAICRASAVKFKWDSSSELLQKQIAEHALGIIKEKKGKIVFFTFLINMTKDCDCIGGKNDIMMNDIGVLAGTDPVAIDQAVIDLTKQNGKSIAEQSYPNLDPSTQLEYGESIGLGVRKYNLKEIIVK